MQRNSCPDFSDLMSRLSRLKPLARNCNLGQNLDAARPLVRFIPYFPDLMTRLSRLRLSARLYNLGPNPDAARPLARFIPDFPDLMTRLSMFKLSPRLCNLGPNPDAAQIMYRLSRPSVQTQTLGTNLQFGSKSGYSANIGAIHVQTFQTLCPDFPNSNCWRDSALGLNPDGTRPLARLWSKFFSPYVQPFQTEYLGRIMQFEFKLGCGAALGAARFQIFQTL